MTIRPKLGVRPSADSAAQRARELVAKGQFTQAVRFARQWTKAAPNDPTAHTALGVIANNLYRPQEALEAFSRAPELDPKSPQLWFYRGAAHADLANYAAATADYERAIELNPRFHEAMAYLSEALAKQGATQKALGLLERALAVSPSYPLAWLGRGQVLLALSRREEAELALDRAILLEPNSAQAWLTKAHLLVTTVRRPQAVSAFQSAMRLGAPQDQIDNGLFVAASAVFDWSGFKPRLERLMARARSENPRMTPGIAHLLPTTPEQQLRISRRFTERFLDRQPLWNHSSLTKRESKQSRIRIGYYSRDFRDHATSQLIVGVFEAHNRDNFEVFGFDHSPHDTSTIRKRVVDAFDTHRNLARLSEFEMARSIRQDDVDILVDLDTLVGLGRPETLSWRPAPIQINYLGLPGTTGARFYDYMIADRVTIPEHSRQFYSERIVFLPHTYQPTDRMCSFGDERLMRKSIGLPEDVFVFASFNGPQKLSPDHFSVWARILRAVPHSVLWIFVPEDSEASISRLRSIAGAQGIEPQRLIDARQVTRDQHIARMGLADLFLDTVPYNAHTTASEALWAGLPILTVMAEAFAGRVAASVLKAAGLSALIASDLADYERRAIALATTSRADLRAYRDHLKTNRLRLPLFNTKAYTQAMEAAYQIMHERRLAGEVPIDIELRDNYE